MGTDATIAWRRCAAIILGAAWAVSAGCQAPRGGAQAPVVTAVQLPAMFEADPSDRRGLYFVVRGADLDPASTERVQLALRDESGTAVRARFSHEPTVQDLFFGDGEVVLDVIGSALTPGKYEICAALASNPTQLVCGAFQFLLAGRTPCERKFLEVVEQNPGFGCRCDVGLVRVEPTEKPDGALGEFVSGNSFGSVHEGNLTAARITSAFKYEAHFAVELVNDPGVPPECSAAEWFDLAVRLLCTQGQDTNRTTTFRVGAPDETAFDKQDATGRSFPYDSRKRRPESFAQDGHGYRIPGASQQEEALRGVLKAHEAGPGRVHWLDAPGIHRRAPGGLRGLVPSRQDSFFRMFVTGSTGREGDDCACFVGLRTGVVDGQGAAQPSTVLVEPFCE
jgi:hypothetical protein